jgi:hypothetical protein
MKTLVVAAAFALCASNLAWAAGSSCEAQATDKKLAGAAKTSFMKKCQKDAADAASKDCNAQAADKKLAGAAKTSFVKKCVKDAAEAK